jgi:dTDP-4-amino-4,6-dideoxygalactose transaminase
VTRLAALGDPPRFPDGVPFVRPAIPSLERVVARLGPSWDSGILTNGPLVRDLEERAADYLGVRHVVAVSSCTSGLLLVLQALGIRGTSVVLPSFTFSATAHAAAWNGATPLFAECDETSFQIDTDDAGDCIDGAERIGAVLATHVFGTPAEAEEIEKLGRSASVPVVFDAAHGFGARRRGRPVGGFGDAEVFSLSPTKPVVAGEGGLVSTDDAEIARTVAIGRDYGNPGDYDTRFPGINARMSELHAAVALESLADLDEALARRRELAGRYVQELAAIPGIAPQRVDDGDASTYKDFTVAVLDDFGVDRDRLAEALGKEGIDTRCYFSPPVHQHHAYAALVPRPLPVTERVASRVVSLPLYSSLPDKTVSEIVDVVATVHEKAAELSDQKS